MIKDSESNFYSQMTEMEKRPSLFGLNTVETIETFILGVQTGRLLYSNQEQDLGLDDFRFNFSKYISKKFNHKAHGWSKIVRFYSHNDQDTVKLFFELLNEFKKRKDVLSS